MWAIKCVDPQEVTHKNNSYLQKMYYACMYADCNKYRDVLLKMK